MKLGGGCRRSWVPSSITLPAGLPSPVLTVQVTAREGHSAAGTFSCWDTVGHWLLAEPQELRQDIAALGAQFPVSIIRSHRREINEHVGFTGSPASLQDHCCSPKSGCARGWYPGATQRDGAKDLVRCQENSEDLADVYFAVPNCRSFPRDKKLQVMGQLSLLRRPRKHLVPSWLPQGHLHFC